VKFRRFWMMDRAAATGPRSAGAEIDLGNTACECAPSILPSLKPLAFGFSPGIIINVSDFRRILMLKPLRGRLDPQ
jgi:hypothetical protein